MGIILLVSAQLQGQDNARIISFTSEIEFITIYNCNKEFNLVDDEYGNLFYNNLDYNGYGIHPLNLMIVWSDYPDTFASLGPGGINIYSDTILALNHYSLSDYNLLPVEQELTRGQKVFIGGLHFIGVTLWLVKGGYLHTVRAPWW